MTIGDWRGLPFPGYQWPMMYCIQSDHAWYQTWLNNQVDFLYDSQQAYFSAYEELGPAASAYIWDRPDATAYGPKDTWIFYHWDHGQPWAGYHPRAYMAAARAWYELVMRGRTVPAKLRDYVENWTTWLIWYVGEWGNSPTAFPKEQVAGEQPPNPINAGMVGLWLAGCSYSLLAGSDVAQAPWLCEQLFAELSTHVDVIPASKPGHVMSGGWSPWAAPNGTNGMAYGFYSGEALRGLALFKIWLRHGAGHNLFARGAIPDHAAASLGRIDIPT